MEDSQEYVGSFDPENHNKQPCSIAELIERHDVYFIHGIHPTLHTQENSLLHKNVFWQQRLAIVLAFQPTLSVSSIKSGDGAQHMWSNMGVILRDGDIQESYAWDAGTQATGFTSRTTDKKPSSVEQAIKKSIPNPGYSGSRAYNEFIVDHPAAAAFYIHLDPSDQGDEMEQLALFSEIIKETKAYDLPFTTLVDGKLYAPPSSLLSLPEDGLSKECMYLQRRLQREHCDSVIADMQKAGWKYVSHKDLKDYMFAIPVDRKHDIQQQLFHDHVFKLRSLADHEPEITDAVLCQQGRRLYMESLSERQLAAYPGKEEQFQPWGTLHDEPLASLVDKPVRVLTQFWVHMDRYRYITWNGKVFYEIFDPRQKTSQIIPFAQKDRPTGTVPFGWWRIDIGRYSDARGLTEKIGKKIEVDATQKPNHTLDIRRGLAFQAYGVAIQAQELGDVTTAHAASELVNKSGLESQIHEIVAQRLGEDGDCILSSKDFMDHGTTDSRVPTISSTGD